MVISVVAIYMQINHDRVEFREKPDSLKLSNKGDNVIYI